MARANDLLREARAVLADAAAHAHPAAGTAALRADGPARPYTDRAIAAFRAADPDDVRVAHHLAIAHHARAWDLELQNDPRAAAAWEEALGHWHTVASSAAFWRGLADKLKACDPAADPAPLADARRNLLEHLLDVHVDFIEAYGRAGKPDRAAAHVELVRRAKVPPAVRGKLVGKVYTAMTGGVAEAKAQAAFAAALDPLERFLELFPDHAVARRTHAEVSRDWVAGLSYQTDWDAIRDVSRRAEPVARGLASTTDPSAAAALFKLAEEFARRAGGRARGFTADRTAEELSEADRRAAADALAIGLTWEALAGPFAPAGGGGEFAHCLHQQALLLYGEAVEVSTSSASPARRLAAELRLMKDALARLDRVRVYMPDDQAATHNADLFRRRVEQLDRAAGGGWA